MPQATHTPCGIPTAETISDTTEAASQNAKRIEKIQSHSSSHHTAGTVEMKDQHEDQATVARAYRIWEANGRKFGNSERDWHQAVKEIKGGTRFTVDEGHLASPHSDGVSPYPSQASRDDVLGEAAE